MPDLFDVLHAQRAHRVLLADPVPDALVERLLDAAVHAPSAEDSQPWEFVVVRDGERRAAIAAQVRALWENGLAAATRARLAPRFFAGVDRWATEGLGRAPVLVVVCGDRARCHPNALAASVFPAVQNLLLAAEALGLGAMLSTLPAAAPGLPELLGLPESVVPFAVVPMGWPARRLRPPVRAPFATRTHRERYGSRW